MRSWSAAARYWYNQLTDEEILGPLPDPPTFPEDIALVRDRVGKILGKVSVGKVITIRHPAISRLIGRAFQGLAADQGRQRKRDSRAALDCRLSSRGAGNWKSANHGLHVRL
jgi:hypothetical protein